MRKPLLVLLTIISSIVALGQSQSYEGTIEYQKKDQKAIVIEFPYAPSVVEDAIAEKMEKLGYKKKESKGFLVYKGAVIREISSEPADYLIKVERKSRREKEESVVYILVNKGEENVIARYDALLNSNIKTFMNGLHPHVHAFNLEREIMAQETAVVKAEKKLKDLVEDKETIEKKIKKLQEELEKNTKDQEDQVKQIENEKQTLEAMKGKRRS